MYSEPWARFTKFMMPKTSVSPAASRNSRTPSCRPFSACVTSSPVSTRRYRLGPPGGQGRPGGWPARPSFHLALLVVRVGAVRERRGDGLQVHAALLVLVRLEDMQVVDREVVVA